MSSLDVVHYKEVVGHYATGVVVITAATPAGPVGFTCQTFGSLSLEPILGFFAVRSASQSWAHVRSAGDVGINMLAADQEGLARVFATSGVDKFAGVDWSPAPRGSPLLGGALAHLEGEIMSVATHGDHDLAVVQIHFVHAYPGHPLLYYRGGYGLAE